MQLTIVTGSVFQKDGKNFAIFFLINGQENLKGWQVVPSSIPKFIETFKQMPFISEPELGHFGADNMPIDQVISQQEDFRMGNIIDVKFNEQTMTAEAIVEFKNTPEAEAIWNEINSGKAIYVSPAIAGISINGPRGPIFTEWYGLHLARVGNPAYGVMHATIKQTCSGSEKECIKKLVASASLNTGTSFKCPFGSGGIMSTQLTDEEKKKLAEEEALKKENASLKAQVASLQESANQVKEIQTELATFKAKVASDDAKAKTLVVAEIVELKQKLDITDATKVTEENASLNKLETAELERMRDTLKASVANVEKYMSNHSSGNSRVVQPATIASASKTEIDVRSVLTRLIS